jgi:hypothetical protein
MLKRLIKKVDPTKVRKDLVKEEDQRVSHPCTKFLEDKDLHIMVFAEVPLRAI